MACQVTGGLGTLSAGVNQLADGSGQVTGGLGTLSAGANQMAGGVNQLADGSPSNRWFRNIICRSKPNGRWRKSISRWI